MFMTEKPIVQNLNDGSKSWNHRFNLFTAKIYLPKSNLPSDIINFGFSAPYLLYFTDQLLSDSDAKAFAEKSGLSKIAERHAGSVVFISPNNEGGWEKAPEGIFEEIIENSKIHQYHENGFAILINRFTNSCDGYAIRGAIYKTCVYGKGKAADYIAKNLLKPLNGAGLWGPADVTPTVCILENLSVKPEFGRRNMPVASINNTSEINAIIKESTDFSYFADGDDVNYAEVYDSFAGKFRRWGWTGDLQDEPDFEALGMIEEPCFAEVKTSKDNNGDDKGTERHKIGYISYYNKNLFNEGSVPLLLCFHGGGDSAKYIAQVSEWYKVAHDHNFLLVCIENHLNSTATEMMELIEILKKQYKIDETRIFASGFSMGGCKSWDLYQEYPKVFAGLAPMDATFELGLNVFGQPSPVEINKTELVPVFYAGGEITPLPELPFQAEKCRERMEYVLKVNRCTAKYDVKFEDKDNWENKIWGISGDLVNVVHDNSRDSDLTMNFFASDDGIFYTVFASISGQGHECRYHTCENAWLFLSQFQRTKDGKIVLAE